MSFLLLLATGTNSAWSQKGPEKNWNSARILHEIGKLKHVGRVLYIAAHPDDENTQLISYLSNVMGLETAYLSLTRGDGGQNLLGPEVREELGVIRTQELLMARSIDGGQQFFTRANDFGFSKSASEALHIWDSNEVLSDMVWVIRKFRPDIIITRFSPTYTKTHGHHQASAILATVAFKDAADPTKFPEQLKYAETWQAQSLFWNTNPYFFHSDTTGLCHTNIGAYMPLLGESTAEMAADSRTMHKSQGMGSSPRRGDDIEYFQLLDGKKPEGKDIFSVADFSWKRVKGCEKIGNDVDTLIKYFNQQEPYEAISILIPIWHDLERYKSNYLVSAKMSEIEEIILQCAGVYAEALNTKEFTSPGDSLNISLNLLHQLYNGDGGWVTDVGADLIFNGNKLSAITPQSSYFENKIRTFKTQVLLPDTAHITGPYWLEEEPTVGMYKVSDQNLRGLAQNPPQLAIHLHFHFYEKTLCNVCPEIDFDKDIPVFFKTIDPIKGEQYSLARIVPPALVNPGAQILIFSNTITHTLRIKVKSFTKGTASLHMKAPLAWTIDSFPTDVHMDADLIFPLKGEGNEQTLIQPVSIRDWKNATPNYIGISIEVNGRIYDRSFEEINYDHIPKQILLPRSRVKVEKIDIKTSNRLIGYINGAGDDIPQCLKDIGYKVETISPDQLATADLSKYNTIIAGVRAYNTVDRLKFDNHRLLDFVKNGGTYIVQYNNNNKLVTDSIGPYYLHPSNTRTTEEDCKIKFLNSDNPALSTPNKITQQDFLGWVQERGLYYPDKWDTLHYVPLLEMADKGEDPTRGALLVAKYGKGYFVYTGLSFFRELPAGVPGAYRLMANLIELGKK